MDYDKIIGIVVILLFFFGIGFYSICFSRIPLDENAVLFKRFDGGVDKQNIYMPGTQITAPWNQLISYKITTQEGAAKMSTLSKDKLVYDVEFTYRYRVNPSRLGFLHEEIGANYHEMVMIPALQSGLDEGFIHYLSKDISTVETQRFEDEIKYRSLRSVEEKYLILESISVKKIVAR